MLRQRQNAVLGLFCKSSDGPRSNLSLRPCSKLSVQANPSTGNYVLRKTTVCVGRPMCLHSNLTSG